MPVIDRSLSRTVIAGTWEAAEALPSQKQMALNDVGLFRESLVDSEEAEAFDTAYARARDDSDITGSELDLALFFTMAPNATQDLTMSANHKTEMNNRTLASWGTESLPDLLALTEEWRGVRVRCCLSLYIHMPAIDRPLSAALYIHAGD